jgi:solute carrier family 25 (mitochondrial aspartate/glutamate transporter), member 12/13
MQTSVPVKKDKPKKLPIPVKLTVGAMAGAFGTTCIFPIDMIKTRLQASSGRYTGPVDCFRQIMANEGGVRGFYKGLGPNLGGVCPEKAIKLVIMLGINEIVS